MMFWNENSEIPKKLENQGQGVFNLESLCTLNIFESIYYLIMITSEVRDPRMIKSYKNNRGSPTPWVYFTELGPGSRLVKEGPTQ